jgi:CHAD domain-containing protein
MADGKWIPGLSAGMPIADAARTVLEARFEVVRRYLPLAAEKPHEDPEHVHQLRVGTRRAGAALRVFADALPRRPLKETKRTLRALRRAAGTARDWDVFLATLPDVKPFAAAANKPALDFLVGYAFGERAAAQQRLADAATESGPLFLEQSEELPVRARAPQAASAPANFGELAVAQLGALFRQFNSGVEANPAEPTALHALRIVGKRLRYALEIFADCFPPGIKESVYPAVVNVQELLGGIQDATVGMKQLESIRDAIRAVMAKELTRVRKGFDGFTATLRARVPGGKKAFAAWRKHWLELMNAFKLEVVATTVTAHRSGSA